MDKSRLNGSGYRDDTAYNAMKNMSHKPAVLRYNYSKRDEEADEMLHMVKRIIKLYGFHLIDRIRFEDLKTGKKYV